MPPCSCRAEQELQRLRQIDDASRFDNYRAKATKNCWSLAPIGRMQAPILCTRPSPTRACPSCFLWRQTHDGTTPYRNAQAMAAAFSGHLLTREGTGHTLVLKRLKRVRG